MNGRAAALALGLLTGAAHAAAVVLTGLLTSVLAAAVVRRSPLVPALRSE
jgi:hypothetical protein